MVKINPEKHFEVTWFAFRFMIKGLFEIGKSGLYITMFLTFLYYITTITEQSEFFTKTITGWAIIGTIVIFGIILRSINNIEYWIEEYE